MKPPHRHGGWQTPRSASPESGIALAAVLLAMAAVATMAFGGLLLVLLDVRLAANRAGLAKARAEAGSHLVEALLELERGAQHGELPADLAARPWLLAYARETPTSASVEVAGSAGTARQRRVARIELQPREWGWTVQVIDAR